MGFLDGLRSLFGGGGRPADGGYYIYVRCGRCGEAIRTRVNLHNDLSGRDEGGYVVSKTLVGGGRCFERISVTLMFDQSRRVVDREISGGEFITAQEYAAAQTPSD
jgi:hypothetical protein